MGALGQRRQAHLAQQLPEVGRDDVQAGLDELLGQVDLALGRGRRPADRHGEAGRARDLGRHEGLAMHAHDARQTGGLRAREAQVQAAHARRLVGQVGRRVDAPGDLPAGQRPHRRRDVALRVEVGELDARVQREAVGVEVRVQIQPPTARRAEAELRDVDLARLGVEAQVEADAQRAVRVEGHVQIVEARLDLELGERVVKVQRGARAGASFVSPSPTTRPSIFRPRPRPRTRRRRENSACSLMPGTEVAP